MANEDKGDMPDHFDQQKNTKKSTSKRKPLCIVLGLLAIVVIAVGLFVPLYILEPFDKDDTESPSSSPPPTGTPVVTGLKIIAGLTTVEPTGSRRRQLNFGRLARRLATRPTGGEYADTSDQNEYLEDFTSESLSTPNMIMCMINAGRADAMVNTDNQPYLASLEEDKCESKGGSGGGGGGDTTTNTATAISYMAMNVTRANTGCDASANGCTAPMIIQGHILIPDFEDPNSKQRVYFYMEVTEAAGGTYFNGQFKMDYTVTGCYREGTTQCDDDASYMKMARGTLSVGQGGIPGAISFAQSVENFGTDKSYMTGPADKSSGSGALSYPDWSSCDWLSDDPCTPTAKTLQYGYAGTTYCMKDPGISENCFDRDRSLASESVWQYGLYDDSTGARFELPQLGFGLKTAGGARGWAGYYGIHLDDTALSAMNNQVVTKSDGSGSYTIEVVGGSLRKTTTETKTLDEIDKVEFHFWCGNEVTVGGDVYNSGGSGSTTFYAHWDATSDTFKIVATGWPKTLLSSPETVTAAQLSNFTAYYSTWWNYEPGITGWSEGLGHSDLSISAAVLKSADPGAYANGVKYSIKRVVLPGDTSVPTTLVCLQRCPTYAKLSALTASSTVTDAYTDATKNGDDIALADAVSYTFDPSQMTIKYDSESNPVSSSAIQGAARENSELSGGVRMTLVPDSVKSQLVCESNTSTYCGWKASEELNEYYTYEVGPQDWHSQLYLKDDSSSSYIAFSPPLKPSFVVPNQAKYGDYAGSTQLLDYHGHGQLYVPHKCFSKTTNEEEDCGDNSRSVPALSIPYDSDGFVTMQDGSTKWVKWLDKEIRFKHVTDATASGSGITLGDTSGLPASPDPTDSNDAEDPSNTASAKYSGPWPTSTMASTPAVVHGEVCSDTPKPKACA